MASFGGVSPKILSTYVEAAGWKLKRAEPRIVSYLAEAEREARGYYVYATMKKKRSE